MTILFTGYSHQSGRLVLGKHRANRRGIDDDVVVNDQKGTRGASDNRAEFARHSGRVSTISSSVNSGRTWWRGLDDHDVSYISDQTLQPTCGGERVRCRTMGKKNDAR